MKVRAWSEKIIIPTYETGKPEKNPIFLENRVYQGSSGVVYPHPVVEKIASEKVDKEWLACFLENDYLKIMILPELGGRIQMAYDKTKKRHFVYYNEVIKPALVGLTGPWISGGIEFNWPQHHRPSTYDPVDYSIENFPDGSMTVWCSEIERMFRTKGMAGFTLYPDKAYLEIKVRLYNRTSQPQSFLWWANPAVAVNDHYQSVFPPDVHAVFDHGKRDVSAFPIAKGMYYKVDYSPGTDISKYKNIPVPTSFMAIHSDYDFVGGYENDSKGGLLHVANHYISPGKKQWTWGNGDFGQAWDRNLTDRNGPYIELMCGVYTDNQPDFSWLMPYEEKTFNQYFMPYSDLGLVKNASKDLLLNLEFHQGKAVIKIYSTGVFPGVMLILEASGKVILKEKINLNPGTSIQKELDADPGIAKQDYHLSINSNQNKLLLSWSPEAEAEQTVPEPAQPVKEPGKINTNEELFLNGLHLEQYRHASFDPTRYYLEALKRDPNDIRCNNAMGMWFFRRGKFAEAENFFRRAYQTQIQRNPNPYDGEPLFNLGLSLRFQNRDDEAYEAFYKSVWNAAYMDSGYFQISQIDASNQNWDDALETINRSLVKNWHNHKARHLKAAILRKKSLEDDALALINESLKIDRFNFGMYFEKYLLGNTKALNELKDLMRSNIQNYIEIALDYAWAGLRQEAIQVLDIGIEQQDFVYPMAEYYKAWMISETGDFVKAKEIAGKAEKCLPDYCFPNRLEAIPALQFAMEINPDGPKAPYYLGNFYYNARQYEEAREYWEKSINLDDYFPTVKRNLALACYNKFNEAEKALSLMEKAFELDKTDARVFLELIQLYGKLNKSTDFRLDKLKLFSNLVNERDDLYIEYVNLYLLKGNYLKSYDLIMAREFHPWEGGEGKVTGAYIASLIGLARKAIKEKIYSESLDLLNKAKVFPYNLGEGKLAGAQENEINYWLGCAYAGLNQKEEAKTAWEKASSGLSEPGAAWFYNDQQPDTIFYQGLALMKLGKEKEANQRFNKLISYGEKHFNDKVKIDYFAVSLPDLMVWDENLNIRNKIHCYYLIGLGHLGLKNNIKAIEAFNNLNHLNPNHLGAEMNRELVEEKLF